MDCGGGGGIATLNFVFSNTQAMANLTGGGIFKGKEYGIAGGKLFRGAVAVKLILP